MIILRTLLLLVAVVALTACAPAPRRCDLAQMHAVTFSSAQAPDIVEARAVGPDCAHAVALLTLRGADGAVHWAWAAPLYPTFGDAFAPRGDAPTREEVSAFLTRWAALTPARTSAAPAWREEVETPLPRALYDDIRARDAPMLCLLSGVARETCLYWESGAAAASEYYRRDAPP